MFLIEQTVFFVSTLGIHYGQNSVWFPCMVMMMEVLVQEKTLMMIFLVAFLLFFFIACSWQGTILPVLGVDQSTSHCDCPSF